MKPGWAIPIAFLVKQHMLEAYVIANDSMSPTLFLNDRIVVDKRAAGEMSFDRWDVVVFRSPEERKKNYIKRIIGLPGETIKVDEQGKMTIDGKSLEELDSTSKEATTPLLDQEASEWTVPPNEVFVLGDNRTDSHDSRHFGTVHIGDVLGPVSFIFMPSENWSRFGRFEP